MSLKFRLLFMVIVALSLMADVHAQGIYLESVDGLEGPAEDSTIVADGRTKIVFNLRLVGLNEVCRGITAGFKVWSDEGAEWTDTELDTLEVGTAWSDMWDSVGGFFENHFSVTGSGVDTIGIGAVAILEGLPAQFDAVAFSITIGPIASEHAGKTICLDSCFYPPVGYWIMAGSEWSFEWSGPHRFTLVNSTDVKNVDGNLPAAFSLSQNYPNPFNPSTEILFEVPTRSRVTIGVFNILGQKVKTLVDEELAAGSYSRVWDGTNDRGESLSSGIYLYRMESGDYARSRKMILVK